MTVIGELDQEQIDDVLRTQAVGRIGVHADGRTYVVPISYVYDGDTAYLHSPKGMKIEMMRRAPEVCFKVDDIQDLANWRSVIAWGRFEELTGDLAKAAIKLLFARLAPLSASETAGAAGHVPGGGAGVPYRIRLVERTGRYERRR